MKRLMMVAALALSGCVAGQEDAAVQFTAAVSVTGTPGAACTPDGTKVLSRGRLNIGAGGNYTLAVQVRSTIPAGRTVSVGGSNVSVGGENATLTKYVYSYQSSVALDLPKEELVDTYSVIKPATADNLVLVNAFGPDALKKLLAAAGSGKLTDTPVSVIVTIQARGRLGTTGNLETNELSFPLSVVNGGCQAGQTQTSVCNPGQDFTCTAPGSTP